MKMSNCKIRIYLVAIIALCSLLVIPLLFSTPQIEAAASDNSLESLVVELREKIRTEKEAGNDVTALVQMLNKSKREVQAGNDNEGIRILQEALALEEGTLPTKGEKLPPKNPTGNKPPKSPEIEGYLKEIRSGIQDKKQNGEDVSQLLELLNQSKQKISEGNDEEGLQLLQEALELLNSTSDQSSSHNNQRFGDSTKKPHYSKNIYRIKLPIAEGQVMSTTAVPQIVSTAPGQNNEPEPQFHQEILPVRDGFITIAIDDAPVFLEILADASKALIEKKMIITCHLVFTD